MICAPAICTSRHFSRVRRNSEWWSPEGAEQAHDNARFVPFGRDAVFAGEPTAARKPSREGFTVGERSEQTNVARSAARDQHERRPVLGASRIGTHRARGEDS